jgi:hypothetical protein
MTNKTRSETGTLILLLLVPHLQGICCNLVRQANATPFLLQVYDHAASCSLYVLQGKLQLLSTVTLQ